MLHQWLLPDPSVSSKMFWTCSKFVDCVQCLLNAVKYFGLWLKYASFWSQGSSQNPWVSQGFESLGGLRESGGHKGSFFSESICHLSYPQTKELSMY